MLDLFKVHTNASYKRPSIYQLTAPLLLKNPMLLSLWTSAVSPTRWRITISPSVTQKSAPARVVEPSPACNEL